MYDIFKMPHNTFVDNKNLELAKKRTNLANMRTFLSYFRTSLISLSVALALIKLEKEKPLDAYSITLLALSGIILVVGIIHAYLSFRSIDNMTK